MSDIVPWKVMLAAAAAASFLMTKAPYNLPEPIRYGFAGTTVLLYFLQFTGWALYWIFLWPKFLSPLRDLPEPSVWIKTFVPPPGASFKAKYLLCQGNHWLMGQFGRIRKETTGLPQREWYPLFLIPAPAST